MGYWGPLTCTKANLKVENVQNPRIIVSRFTSMKLNKIVVERDACMPAFHHILVSRANRTHNVS